MFLLFQFQKHGFMFKKSLNNVLFLQNFRRSVKTLLLFGAEKRVDINSFLRKLRATMTWNI